MKAKLNSLKDVHKKYDKRNCTRLYQGNYVVRNTSAKEQFKVDIAIFSIEAMLDRASQSSI